MGRNAELIRQWQMLMQLASSRGNTIPKLARDFDVTTRTVRRDLKALQAVGFPIYDESVNGTKFWRMNPSVLGALARSGLTLPELCAFYFSRSLLECFAGTPMRADLKSAFDKFEKALTPAMKKFLDRLPRVIAAKAPQAKKQDHHTYQMTARLLEASLERRVIAMRYDSRLSGKEKDYVVHPYRLAHVQGGLYLYAFVPAYSDLRTFAVERVRKVTLQQKTFEVIPDLDIDPFAGSMGAHRGPTVHVTLHFDKAIVPVIKDRTWHASQEITDHPDGSVTMVLEVCDDYALRNWILGFGRLVRVVAPAALVEAVTEELSAARGQYGFADTPILSRVFVSAERQATLPFIFSRVASA